MLIIGVGAALGGGGGGGGSRHRAYVDYGDDSVGIAIVTSRGSD